MALTTIGFVPRVRLLIINSRFDTLIFFFGVWGVSLLALIIAAAQPNRLIRWMWALLFSASAALAQLYYVVSGSELGVFDFLSLWNARHEGTRALDRYAHDLVWPVTVFLFSLVVMVTFPVARHRLLRRALTLSCWVPIVPISLIGGIVMIRDGGGSQALPQQFVPLAVSAVSFTRIVTRDVKVRKTLSAAPARQPLIGKIVLLVDESIRGDYLDFRPGNRFTPALARAKDRIVNFGPAVSASNCSHYTNALLRLGGTSSDPIGSVSSNPSLWQYAKQAGYRTVFIDAQATVNKSAGRLHNFMTPAETQNIDRFVSFDDTPIPMLDFRLLDVVKGELAASQPVFIYANKNGAHFPYEAGYPETEAVLEPSGPDVDRFSTEALIKEYRNNIAWTVDRFFADMLAGADFSDTLVLYTSDHGQNFVDGKSTHCSVTQADPREGLVPILAVTDQPDLHARLSEAAEMNWAATSHFQITPSVLQFMGYDAAKIRSEYGPSLFEAANTDPAFTSGDIFGLFQSSIIWNPIDLRADHLEPQARFTPGHPTDQGN